MGKHKAPILAAVVMMLGAATSAQATYCEKWAIPWSSGTITYNGTTYTLRSGTGYTWCIEGGDDCLYGMVYQDEFLNAYTDWAAVFTANSDRDTLYLKDSTYTTGGTAWTTEGCKQTGQSGYKEAFNCKWCAYESENGIFFWGTWDTNEASEYFYYSGGTPTANGGWDVSGVSSGTASGSGSWSGSRTDNQNPCMSVVDD